jgi:cytochrome c biogenesis protein CcdA/thiol-disulfide isomerase/thioredoxin
MQSILNIILGFLEGFALILSPCILPILPIVLAGSLTGSKQRPLGIILGFILAFSLFTFFSRALVQYSGIDLSFIRHLSYALLFLLGIIMLSTFLSEKFSLMTQKIMTVGSSFSGKERDNFFGGIIFGGLIGLIWTPCAGPILAAVIVQSVVQQSTLDSFFIVLAFGVGAALPMLIIALFGRSLLDRMTGVKKHTILIRKLLGIIIIASVAYMMVGFELLPSFGGTTASTSSETKPLINALPIPYAAPEISNITAWINSKPLTLNELRGKVVLIDFWAYSCINCIRTFPYLKDWYAKYHDKGLEIIGVHAPEFEFEKSIENVSRAVKSNGIQYPVALDNQFSTWQNYHNRYWPAHYLIDKNGQVVYQHFGEGEYAVTENNIRFLLGMGEKSESEEERHVSYAITPETYLGYARAANFAGDRLQPNIEKNYQFPNALSVDAWALQGDWQVESQNIVSVKPGARLKLHFHARKVFIVMGAMSAPIRVEFLLNGKLITNEKGRDVKDSVTVVDQHRLYEVVVLPNVADGILELTASSEGLQVYTFTFE